MILPILATCVLVAWMIYSVEIGIGLGVMCMVIAAFYAGTLSGPADKKTLKTFSVLVLALSILMIGIVNHETRYEDAGPRMCSGVAC